MEKKNKELESLGEQFAKFKSGETDKAPIVYRKSAVKFQVNEGKKQVILSVEETDSDGEVVEMAGGSIRGGGDSVPMIDSHNSWSSVVQNGLGAVRNCKFGKNDMGKPCLMGEPDFAPTPNGDIAKILYMGVDGGKPYFTDVSMGFMVYDYNNETKHITKWEIFELSLVTAGANRSARFTDKALDPETLEDESNAEGEASEESKQIAKDLSRFKQIHKPFKEFTKLFLSDEFLKKIEYTKDGDLSIDINSIYDKINLKLDKPMEAPKVTQEAPIQVKQKAATKEAVEKALLAEIVKQISKIS